MSHTEIFSIATNPRFSETGGGHNQKGVNFQRVWAVARMVELDQANQDFLMLFEGIQDVAEFDSETEPTSVRVYQVKKKDNGVWSWNDLTDLYKVDSARAKSQSPDVVKTSALGKLYETVVAFKELKSSGHFVSNLGCDVLLNTGKSAAVSAPCDLSLLEATHLERLKAALATFHPAGALVPDLARLHLIKVPIHPDAPEHALTGLAFDYLKAKSPHHAAQAASLVATLLIAVGTRSAKTDACHTYAQLREQHGFSRKQFKSVLASLEHVPDVKNIVEGWLNSWPDGSLSFIMRTRIKVQLASIFQARLSTLSDEDAAIVAACDTWLIDHPVGDDLPSATTQAEAALRGRFADLKPERLIAHYLMRAAEQCVDPTSGY